MAVNRLPRIDWQEYACQLCGWKGPELALPAHRAHHRYRSDKPRWPTFHHKQHGIVN